MRSIATCVHPSVQRQRLAGPLASTSHDSAQLHPAPRDSGIARTDPAAQAVAGTAERIRLHKILEQANVRIGSVLSDVFGMTGQAILEALLKGKATPEEMAKLARGKAKRKVPQLVEALKGHRLTDAQRFLIEHCLQHMAFLEQSLEQLEARILQQIEEAGLTRPFELLQTVPAIKQAAAASVLAEIGSSMEPFPTPGQLASWAGVCPGNNRSGRQVAGHPLHQGEPMAPERSRGVRVGSVPTKWFHLPGAF